jgi:hypothetical protein
MRGVRIGLGLAGLIGGLALAGLVAAQEANKTAPAAPAPTAAPAVPAPAVVTVPTTPAQKALANALTPDEGAPSKEPVEKDIKAQPLPPEPKVATEPQKRQRYTAAVMQAVDKITAETLRFETKVGEPVRFKGLILTIRACETTAADEATPDNIAYLDVQSQPLSAPGHAGPPPRQVFRGWMFASAPAIHPFEHPIYDLWLIACKSSAPVTAAPIAPKSPAPPAKAAAKRT